MQFPDLLFRLKALFAVSIGSIYKLRLLLLPQLLLLFLLLVADANIKIVDHAVVKSLLVEARVVLKSDRQKGTKTRHSEEVHAWFTHYFLHKQEVRQHFSLLLLSLFNRLSIFVFFNLFYGCVLFFWDLGIVEHVESKALGWQKRFVDQILNFRCSVRVLDNLFAFVVQVSLVVVAFIDRLLGCYQVADVRSSCSCELLQVFNELLEVVAQVTRAENCFFESLNLSVPFVNNALFLK